MPQPYLVAIAGGSGSGKSHLADEIVRRLPPDSVAVVSLDDYYRDLSHLEPEERETVNFDHPDALDLDLFREQVRKLKAGRAVEMPVYDFTVHNRSGRTRHVEPRPVIILEGLFVLTDPVVRDLCDLGVFVETDPETCLARRIERDKRERGRIEEDIRRQFTEKARPMYEEHVAPTRRHADIVLSGAGDSAERGRLIEALAARVR